MNASTETSSSQLETSVSWLLKEVDIRLEIVSLPYLDGEEMMVIYLGFSVKGILGEARSPS